MGYSREMSIEQYGLETTLRWEEQVRKQAEESYEENPRAERKHCHQCGQLMRYDSLAYHEGYHFDSCY